MLRDKGVLHVQATFELLNCDMTKQERKVFRANGVVQVAVLKISAAVGCMSA